MTGPHSRRSRLVALALGVVVSSFEGPSVARVTRLRRSSGANDDFSGPGRMPVDEGAISAHEFARSANAVPLSAPPPAPEELTDLQQQVFLRKSTEPQGWTDEPGGLDYNLERDHGTKYPQTGAFHCVACGTALYWSRSKFGSGSGWPAFYEAVAGAVTEIPEQQQDPLSSDLPQHGTELICAKCKGHLGHSFVGEGFGTPTDVRHCVNGVCLRYEKATPGHPDEVKRQFHLTLAPIPP